MRDSVESYLKHGANLSSEKSFRYRENFIAWGTQVRGRRGLVGSTLEKRHQIGVLVFELVCLRVCDGPTLDTVLGSLVHPFSHRPELSSVLHRIYKWRHSLVDGVVYKFPGDIRDELCVAVLFLALCDVNVRAPCEDVLRATDATPTGFGGCVAPCPARVMRALFRFGRHRGEHVRLDWADTNATWMPSWMPKADAATNALFEQLPWRVSNAGRFRHSGHINLQETRALKAEIKNMILQDPTRCKLHRRSVVGVDSRVLCGAGMKGRSSSYRLNGVLRTLTSLLISYRISIALPWVATHSNPADHPSRRAPLPPPATPTPEVCAILGVPVVEPPAVRPVAAFGAARLVRPVAALSRAKPLVPRPRSPPTGSGCALPTVAELSRRIELALGNKGERMQENVCSQQLRRCLVPPAGSDHSRFECAGGFRELFAGGGGITADMRKHGETDCIPYEAFPESLDDSGLKAPRYCAQFDILCPMVLLSLLLDIYGRVVTRLHLGPPCQTWGLLFQNMGPGTRKDNLWQGRCVDEREIRGNRTMGATLLLLRAVWECSGRASLEHPLTSRIWRLAGVRALGGLPGIRIERIDQCAFDLKPGDDTTGVARYYKPTKILLCGHGVFNARLCDRTHPHTQILGSYATTDASGKSKRVQRSHEAGAYPPPLCKALGAFQRV